MKNIFVMWLLLILLSSHLTAQNKEPVQHFQKLTKEKKLDYIISTANSIYNYCSKNYQLIADTLHYPICIKERCHIDKDSFIQISAIYLITKKNIKFDFIDSSILKLLNYYFYNSSHDNSVIFLDDLISFITSTKKYINRNRINHIWYSINPLILSHYYQINKYKTSDLIDNNLLKEIEGVEYLQHYIKSYYTVVYGNNNCIKW